MIVLTNVLSFADPPKMLAFSFPPALEAGTDISVSCSANKGTKPIRYTWYYDGNILNPGLGVEIESTRNALNLAIISATSKHSGNYTCIAKNSYGSDSYSASLNIRGISKIFFVCSH